MLKKFLIEKVDHLQISETTGKMTFYLTDENGDSRSVQGSTFLDENQQPQGISTDNIRELPLIENLFSNRDKKFIDVEFDPFNEVYDREKNKTINQVAYDVVMEMQQEKKFSKLFKSIFKNNLNTNKEA